MQKIESFQVNHDLLNPGIYISRIDSVEGHPVTTFDIRCKRPNADDFMPLEAMHTVEHLGATFFRNSHFRDRVIYFGAMACSTGFYLVLAGDYPVGGESHAEAVGLILDMWRFINAFDGEIPGATRIECGNFKAHDLTGAKEIAREFIDRIPLLEYTYRI